MFTALRFLPALFLAWPVSAALQAAPRLPSEAPSPERFVPAGWQIETRAQGDLDGDGRRDLAMILLAGPGVPVRGPAGEESRLLMGAPRVLAIALARPDGGYRLAVQENAFLPVKRPPNGLSQGWMLFGDGSLAVAGGRLRVIFEYTRASTTFTFRRERGAFRLIGFDSGGVSAGCFQGLSVNFLTRRAKLTAGWIDRDAERVRWRRLPAGLPPALGEIGEGETYDPHGLLTGSALSCPERE